MATRGVPIQPHVSNRKDLIKSSACYVGRLFMYELIGMYVSGGLFDVIHSVTDRSVSEKVLKTICHEKKNITFLYHQCPCFRIFHVKSILVSLSA